MLLFCCFRDAKKQKKKKKEIQKNVKQGTEDPSSPDDPTSTVHSATLRSNKEKYPPSKQEKRLLKQKSVDSIHTRDINQHQDTSHRQSINLTGKTNIKSLHGKHESLPNPPTYT
eukprot:TRINITY_DN8426_c0_g1_i1.p1 TRINITY_DN8426_c0_g1~~TRINITY_DN8426_c0_g1_i1.p1  ORF type:complete len:114 (-),score=27.12 TRINITY_DN8426_c0_g1_i1:229-570(-)